MKKAIVLLSGGLDSAAVLYLAKKEGFSCSCLIFDYGQRHKREIESARRIAASAGCRAKVLKIPFPREGSSLLGKQREVPLTRKGKGDIPSTYVPARNIIFLSLALSYAEASGAGTIFIGAHSQDYSGYPDCRPQFYRIFQRLAACGTKSGVEGRGVKIRAPFLNRGKASIIRTGISLGVPFHLSWSCYKGGLRPCGKCESCYFRAKGFKEAGVKDPLDL
ncbi:MAG: 7-cyano-7-deazaguanine synthase QueC [Candidatus Omnitrophota bacterium]